MGFLGAVLWISCAYSASAGDGLKIELRLPESEVTRFELRRTRDGVDVKYSVPGSPALKRSFDDGVAGALEKAWGGKLNAASAAGFKDEFDCPRGPAWRANGIQVCRDPAARKRLGALHRAVQELLKENE